MRTEKVREKDGQLVTYATKDISGTGSCGHEFVFHSRVDQKLIDIGGPDFLEQENARAVKHIAKSPCPRCWAKKAAD